MSTAEKLTGANVGRYRLLGEVARGGMATVHFAQLAAAHGFEKWVAVKLMHEHMSQDPTFVRMFLDEARIVSQLNHPNICQVLDFGDDDERLFLVMEYLHGETLASVVLSSWRAGKRVPYWFAARTIADCARGLHAAHELKDRSGKLVDLVHRDVSPQNVMVLYDGVSKLMDFGVVRAEGRLTETAAGTLKGKFGYMSPEQLRGAESDKRSDIWALGVMLWELACGRRLFRAKGEGQTAVMVLQGDIADPRTISEDCPDALAEVIMSCLQRDPNARMGTARDVAVGLERFLLETGTLAAPEDVGAFLEERFPGRNAERHAELQRRQDGVVSGALTDDPTTLSRVRLATGASVFATPGRRGAAAALLLLLLVFGAGLVWKFSSAPETSEPLAQVPAQAPPTTTPVVPPVAVPPVAVPPVAVPANVVEVDDPPTMTAAIQQPEQVEPANEAPAESSRRAPRPRRERRTARSEEAAMAGPMGGTGTLNLLTVPSATVRLGNRALGRTPLIGRELPAGRHRLTLTDASGNSSTLTVTIRAGERTARSLSL